MATQSVPNLIQGVTQQAPQQRRDSQCEEQFDCFNSTTHGAAARPPAEVVKVWTGRDWEGAFLHEIERGDENYLAAIIGNSPAVINLDSGVDATITGAAYPNTTDYLDDVSGVDPRDAFRAQSVEDVTFVGSRYVVPAMASTTKPTRRPEALVFVRSAGFKATYRLEISGISDMEYLTEDSAGDGGDGPAQTTAIAEFFRAAIVANLGWNCTRNGSSLLIWRTGNFDFDISAHDDNGDDFMYAFKGFCSSYEKLPRKGFDGVILEVQGESRTQVDNFWVEFQGDPSTGSWREVAAPGVKTTIDADTMPHALTLTALDTFTWTTKTWSTRIAGDEDTAKDPSFIGRKMRDLFYHKDRLGVLYDGGAVWSKTRFPYTFFPDTLQTVLANAPVDTKLVAGAKGKGSVIPDFSVQIDEALFLWGQKVQWRISSGNDNFKQESISSDPSTAYEYAPGAIPLPLGSFLLFPSEVGPYSTLRSVRFQQGKPLGDVDVSAQVDKYLPAGVRGLTASDTLRCLFMWADAEPDRLAVWNYLYQGEEYAQSAWNKWRLPGGSILWAGIKGNILRVLQQRPEGVALLRFNLTPKMVDSIAGATYLTRLDYRVDETQVTGLSYDAGTNLTVFTLPYSPTNLEVNDVRVVLAEAGGDYNRGRVYPITSVVGPVVTVTGDLTGLKFYCGQRILATRDESEFYVRTERGVVPFDRLNVGRFSLEVADTGYTRLEVLKDNQVTKRQEFTGRTSGLPLSDTGTPPLGSGSVDIGVDDLSKRARIRIVNDSFLPSYWQSASYDYDGVGKSATPGSRKVG